MRDFSHLSLTRLQFMKKVGNDGGVPRQKTLHVQSGERDRTASRGFGIVPHSFLRQCICDVLNE